MVKDTKDAPKTEPRHCRKARAVEGGTMLNVRGKEVFVPNPSPTEPTNQRDIQCNLSALLILIVEQQAVITELLSFMMDNRMLSEAGLVRISNARNNQSITTPLYGDFYNRFTDLFLRTKWFLLSDEEKAAFTAPEENSAKDENEAEENKDG